jgi:hypothetical protein
MSEFLRHTIPDFRRILQTKYATGKALEVGEGSLSRLYKRARILKWTLRIVVAERFWAYLCLQIAVISA